MQLLQHAMYGVQDCLCVRLRAILLIRTDGGLIVVTPVLYSLHLLILIDLDLVHI